MQESGQLLARAATNGDAGKSEAAGASGALWTGQRDGDKTYSETVKSPAVVSQRTLASALLLGAFTSSEPCNDRRGRSGLAYRNAST